MRTLLVVLALLGALAGEAAAATGSLVGVRPLAPDGSWIVLRAAPGTVASADAVVLNLTDEPQAVDLSTADATTTADGVFTLAGAGEAATGVGAWIDAPTGRLRLAPRERRVVPLRVRVPADARPGDHAGGLVVQSASAAGTAQAGGVAVRVVERVGLRVYVTVEGARVGAVAVDGLAAEVTGRGGLSGALGLGGRAGVRFGVRNAGNMVHERLRGEVALVEGGRTLATRPLDLGTLLPGDVRPVGLELPLPRWSPGDYRVEVRIHGEPPATAAAGVHVGGARLWGAGGLALGAVALTGAGVGLRRRRAA
ncbi:WxL protein peptidoglycan domain-containing protein [Miltoncostaea marina]|uniref:WxL protein peptidoglycan domain-containing protein n=1 Tax=Miltoncostaea marina TaxID=2843215 RepID=UPI001C3D5448|nr:DUF916 domain-containing protein [Miltoncostaea marina]